jgi:hypothetical protein
MTETQDRPHIEEVRQNHTDELLAQDGISGVGIGHDPDGNQVFYVYVDNETVSAPKELDGYPVITKNRAEEMPQNEEDKALRQNKTS